MAIPVEAFFLTPDGEGTLQQQVRGMVMQGILSNLFPAGARLPSSRKLAEHLGTSRITVTLAYTDLVASDYLVSRGRSGYFVSESAPRKPEFQLPATSVATATDWSRAIGSRFSGSEIVTRPRNWRDYPYPFIYGQADARLFDHHNWRACALRALSPREFEATTLDQYDQDDPKLVDVVQRHILPRRGIRARPEQILITMGAQNALWMAAEILLTQRRVAVHENPCYPEQRKILERTRCTTVALDVDEGGLDPETLPDRVDVVFTTASHQCPTNVTMPVDRRRRLIELAARRGFVIVEDDYEFEIPDTAAPAPSLKAMDRGGAVVHVGSFSKSLFPGLRLGYLVADEAFIREARSLRALILRHPPGHIQRTAAYFLGLGHYDSQLNRMARAYRRRRAEMDAALRAHGLLHGPDHARGGSSFWIDAGEGVDTSALARNLLADGVVTEPGSVFFSDRPAGRRFFRLGYSSIDSGKIPEGIRRIAARLEQSGCTRP
ncbi:aminotransferase class I/II-fold pyridoxal phosphate-dependent enzyme [Rhodobacteraceae bacterium 2CG4]|uniref:Aminotransferase class I/II-fold pyridoxal phosphate-dependent enzyme n=1 Tax=Halovulum marinum TaxID=2662447 RepID=A0A6L5YZT5_9RHOB|nr:PLP-dependent aminotransferase family protein [Halovulum marinum]MSU89244.1 aminotransferase class I/II-fold pyridoxal phosphate-dependent enzyme [Halovulum marinum]